MRVNVHKLILLFRRPENVLEFERLWSEEFVRKAEMMPGLRRVSVSRIHEILAGEVGLHLVHEFFFDDAQSLREAMASPEGQTAGRALMSFAADHVTLCFAEHLEEGRGAPTA
jgi:uncharacterized protein (TIGR02118 family)